MKGFGLRIDKKGCSLEIFPFGFFGLFGRGDKDYKYTVEYKMNGKKGTIEIESDNKLSMRDRSNIKKLLPQRLQY